jgi:hypothetical protein
MFQDFSATSAPSSGDAAALRNLERDNRNLKEELVHVSISLQHATKESIVAR